MNRFDKFFEGYELEAYKLFGAHKKENGVEFTLWAPNAAKVEVFTSREDFSSFYPMEKIDNRGIWNLYIPDMDYIYSYKYRIYKNNRTFHDKSDPYAYYFERRPANASVMYDLNYFTFSDKKYMKNNKFSYDNKLNIYEVHLNGFRKDEELANYRQLKEELIPYVKRMGYSHIELMPVFEHPFDGSWGYQATGFFGCTSRYGTPYDLMDFINECHKNDIGVLLDVVYVHFAKDDFALNNFDFTNLYEYKDKKLAQSQWGTYCFDLNSNPVLSFIMSSANFFLKEYHFDGLRFDAVSNLIYHEGNKNIGLNYGGVNLLKRMNYHLKENNPNCILIAEDSTDHPNVTKSNGEGGLNFDYKWDLGWMNDTLDYYSMDPIYRKYHHNQLTFSMSYFYSEKFILPFSHDEVVHSKKTIIDKMFGTYEEKFSQCRNLFIYMYTHPGKKLNFMGNEIAMFREFDEKKEIDWFMLKYPIHDSFNRFIKELNQLCNKYPAFYTNEYNWDYFKWIDADNNEQSIYSYYRFDDKYCFVTVLNMLPKSYDNYVIGVPFAGRYYEVINSEKDIYNGCNYCNEKPLYAHKKKSHGLNHSIKIKIAPYSAMVFRVKI